MESSKLNRGEAEQSGDRQSQPELTNRLQELTTEGSKTESSSNKALELTEDENLLLSILNKLKEQAGLSNKKWDKAIKGVTKNKVARVEKTNAGLFCFVDIKYRVFRK